MFEKAWDPEKGSAERPWKALEGWQWETQLVWRGKNLGSRVSTFTPACKGPVRAPAVAQLSLGSLTFFAAREAQAASGSALRLASPQLRL